MNPSPKPTLVPKTSTSRSVFTSLPKNSKKRVRVGEFWWWLIEKGNSGRGEAKGLLKIWVLWENFARKRAHVQEVRSDGILDYHLQSYRGAKKTLKDGTVVTKGSEILVLHLANHRLTKGPPTRGLWRLIDPGMKDAQILCDLLRKNYPDVVAVHGASLLAGMLGNFGFEITPLPDTPFTRLQTFFFIGLLAIYHPDGWQGANRTRVNAWPKEAWMSRDAFLKKFSRSTESF